ncbi:hypothetical protein [Streptomyces sp. NPDC046985]|uniref:hypothetical protein n=1 Tax=Streptomyces sp. NPDC046985 TaxID=3155377 RepID=UPI0033E1EE06
MTDIPVLDGLLRRALLAYNARALHTGAEAGAHTAAFLTELAADLLVVMDTADDPVRREFLAEAYRCLSMAADNPLGQSCREREELVNIACHGLAHALLTGPAGRASEEEVHGLLAEQWTASLLAWSQIFSARLDTVSPPCACGALGTRPVLVPAEGS